MNDKNLNPRLSVAQQKKHWLDEITVNADVVKLLHSYDPRSVEIFLGKYINQKVLWHMQSEKDASKNECAGLKWIDSAFRHFEIILQNNCLMRNAYGGQKWLNLMAYCCVPILLYGSIIFCLPFY